LSFGNDRVHHGSNLPGIFNACLSDLDVHIRIHRAFCRFLNSTTTLSASAFPTFRGACARASPQKTWPALLSDVGLSPSFKDESVSSIAQYAECMCRGVLSAAPS